MREKSLVRRIYPEKTIRKIEKKIKLLGLHCKYNAIDLLNYRLLTNMFIFFVLLAFNKNGYIIAPIATILFHYLSEYLVLDYPIKKREKKLEEEAIFFFEVLSLTLESGRNLTLSLQITSRNIDSELSEEFQKSLQEMSLGKSFQEAITAINNALLNIVQSSIFGNNIEESLNNQLDFLRDKRLLDIKSQIGKLPTKISIISVLFFIPIILLVILAPVLIDLIIG